MARLRLEKINGQWYLINKTSGIVLAKTTEETQKALRYIGTTNGSQFTLEIVQGGGCRPFPFLTMIKNYDIMNYKSIERKSIQC